MLPITPIAELQLRSNDSAQRIEGVRVLLGGSDVFNPVYFQADTAIVKQPNTDQEEVIWVGRHVWLGSERQAHDLVPSFYEEQETFRDDRSVTTRLFINR